MKNFDASEYIIIIGIIFVYDTNLWTTVFFYRFTDFPSSNIIEFVRLKGTLMNEVGKDDTTNSDTT